MKNVISKIVSQALYNYIDPLLVGQLELEIFKGKAKIENLAIKESALAYHDLPFSVKKGLIETANVSIPWSSLQSEPCILELDEVYIFGFLQEEVIITSQLQLKRSILNSVEQKTDNAKTPTSLVSILNNLQINIKNIHICLEVKSPAGPIHAGITLKELKLISCDENGKPGFFKGTNQKQYRNLMIDSLSFYMDTEPEKIDFDNFAHFMKNSIASSHQRILPGMIFSTRFELNDDHQADFKYTFKLITEQIKLQIDEPQYVSMMQLFSQLKKFQQKIRFGTCGRPTISPVNELISKQWFSYGYRCIQEQKEPNKLHVVNILAMLKNRKNYYNLWKEKSQTGEKFKGTKNDILLQKLEDRLELNTILFLRSYSETKMRKEQAKAFTKDELEQLSALKNKYSSNNSFFFNVDIRNLIINIQTKEKSNLGTVIFNQINGFFYQNPTETKSNLNLSQLEIYSQTKTLLSEKDLNEKQCARIIYNLKKENMKPQIQVDINYPSLLADMNDILLLMSFFMKNMSSQYKLLEDEHELTKTELLNILQDSIDFDLNLNLNKPEITIPSQSNMKVYLDSLNITKQERMKELTLGNIDSLYDTYDVKLKDYSIKIGDDFIVNNLSMNTAVGIPFIQMPEMEWMRLNMNIPKVETRLTKNNYNELISVIKPLTNLEIPSSTSSTKTSKNTKKQKLSMNITIDKLLVELLDQSQSNKLTIDNFAFNVKDNSQFSIDSISIKSDYFNDLLNLQMSDCPSIVCKMSEENKVDVLNLTIFNNTMKLNFQWINWLTNFFKSDITIPKSKDKPTTTVQKKTKLLLNFNNPNFILELPGKEKLIDLSAISKSVSIDVNEENKINVKLDDMKLLIDDRLITENISTSITIDDDDINSHLQNIELNIIQTDFDLFMHTIFYLRSSFSPYDPNNKSKSIINMLFDNLIVNMMENKEKRMIANLNNMKVDIADDIRFSIQKIKIDQFYTENNTNIIDLDEIEFNMKEISNNEQNSSGDEKILQEGEVKLGKINQFIATEKAIQYLYALFVPAKNPPIVFEDTYPESRMSVKLNLSEKLSIPMYSEKNINIANASFDGLILDARVGNGKPGFIIDLSNLIIVSALIENKEFAKFDEKIRIQMTKDDKVILHLNNVETNFDYDLFMQIISFSSNLISTEPKYEKDPISLPLFTYDISIEIISMNLLYKDDENHYQSIPFALQGFDLQFVDANEMNIKLNCIASDNLLKIENISSNAKLNISKSLPSLINNDESIIERYKSFDRNYLHGINLNATIPSISFSYSDEMILKLLKSLKFIFDIINSEPLFVFETNANLILDQVILTLSNLKLTLNKANYQLNKSHKFTVNSISAQSEVKYLLPIITKFTNDQTDIFEFSMDDKGYDLTFTNAFISIIPSFLYPLIDKLKNSPLIKFEYGFKESQPKGIKFALDNSKIAVPSDIENNGPCLFLDTSVQVTNSDNTHQIFITKLVAAFSQNCDQSRLYPPIIKQLVSDIRLTNNNGVNELSLIISDVNLFISAADIATISLLSKGITKQIPVDKDDISTGGFNASLVKVIKFNLGNINIVLCEDNRSMVPPLPLLRVQFPPASILINFLKQQKFAFEYTFSSIDVFNEITGNWDNLVEPLQFVLHGSEVDGLRFNFDIVNSLNVNLSHRMLKKLLTFMYNIKAIKQNKGVYAAFPAYEVLNKTCSSVDLYLPNDAVLTMAPNESIPTYHMTGDSSVKFAIKRNVHEVALKDLSFPLIPSRDLVIYKFMRGNVFVICITSPFLIENKTSQSLTIFVKRGKNYDDGLEIPSGSFTEIPNFNIKDSFAIESTKSKLVDFKMNDQIISYVFTHENVNSHETKDMQVLIQKRLDPLRGSTIISITTPLEVVNDLPFESMFIINEISILLKPGEDKLVDFVNTSKPIKVKIQMGNGIETSESTLKIEDGYVNSVKVDSSLNIAGIININPDNRSIKVSFYVPAVIYNTTGFDLMVSDEDGTPTKFRPIPGSDKPETNGYVMWGPDSYFRETSSMLAHIAAGIQYKLSTQPIDSLISNVDGIVYLPYLKNPLLNLALHYVSRVDTRGSDGARTRKITLTNHFTIKSTLSYEVKICPIFNLENHKPIRDPIVIPPNSEFPLPLCTTGQAFLFQVDGFRSVPLSFGSPIYTTFRVINNDGPFDQKFICFLITTNSLGSTVTFSDASLKSPLLVKNLISDEPIAAYQIEESTPFTVDIGETKPFAYDFPELNRDVYVLVHRTDIKVDMSELNAPKVHNCRGRDVYIEVRTSEDGSKTVLVSHERQELNVNDNLHFNFSVPQICVSLIHEDLRELALLTIEEIALNYSSVANLSSLQFTIQRLQLDDMFPDVPLPVVAFAKETFINFSAEFYNNAAFASAFKKLELLVNPITAYVDTAFVSEVLCFFSDILRESQRDNFDKTLLKPHTSKMIGANVIFSFENFKLNPINILFSIRSHTNRVHNYPFFSHALYMAPDVTNAALMLDGIEFAFTSVTTSFLVSHVFDNYRKSAMNQILKIIGHCDVLLNISQIGSLYERDIKHFQTGDFSGMKPAIVVGTLTGTESLVRGASSLMHGFIEGDNNRHSGGLNRSAAETVGDGFVSFGKGIALGFAGIVTKPMEEGKKGGFLGGLKGLGKGIAGALAAPVSGVLDIGAGIVGATRKAIEDDNETIQRKRCMRCFFHSRVCPTSEFFDVCQHELQTIDLLRSTYNDTIFVGARIEGGGAICLTRSCLFVFDHKRTIDDKINLKRIEDVSNDGVQILFVKYRGNKNPKQFKIIGYDVNEITADIRSLYLMASSTD